MDKYNKFTKQNGILSKILELAYDYQRSKPARTSSSPKMACLPLCTRFHYMVCHHPFAFFTQKPFAEGLGFFAFWLW